MSNEIALCSAACVVTQFNTIWILYGSSFVLNDLKAYLKFESNHKSTFNFNK